MIRDLMTILGCLWQILIVFLILALFIACGGPHE